MSICSVCGESTQLYVMGTLICVKCDNGSPGERKMRSEQRQGPPKAVTALIDLRARSNALPTN
jgi:hypothetical protein